MQTGYCACTHRTAHRCCHRSRCRRHSATGCGYSSHFGNETRPLRTPWELERASKEEDERFDRTDNEYAGEKSTDTEIEFKRSQQQCSQLCWHQENVTFSVRLGAEIFTHTHTQKIYIYINLLRMQKATNWVACCSTSAEKRNVWSTTSFTQ